MALDPEHAVLFAVGADHVDPDRITRVRFDQWRHGIFLFVHLARLENLTQRTTFLFPELVGFGAIVHRRQTGHILHVRHEGCPDDIVLILEEEGDIPVVPLADVFRKAGVFDDVRSHAFF